MAALQDRLLTLSPRLCTNRTWKKLSPNAKAAAGTIPLQEPLKSMVAEATSEIDKQQAADAEEAVQEQK